jgi:ABC-type siderophore export system fused ATPase/permease subunit
MEIEIGMHKLIICFTAASCLCTNCVLTYAVALLFATESLLSIPGILPKATKASLTYSYSVFLLQYAVQQVLYQQPLMRTERIGNACLPSKHGNLVHHVDQKLLL